MRLLIWLIGSPLDPPYPLWRIHSESQHTEPLHLRVGSSYYWPGTPSVKKKEEKKCISPLTLWSGRDCLRGRNTEHILTQPAWECEELRDRDLQRRFEEFTSSRLRINRRLYRTGKWVCSALMLLWFLWFSRQTLICLSLSVCVTRPKSTRSSCLDCRLILKPAVFSLPLHSPHVCHREPADLVSPADGP